MRIFVCIIVIIGILYLGMPSGNAAAPNKWETEGLHAWSRTSGMISMVQPELQNHANPLPLGITHTGKLDWAVSSGKRIDVTPGETFQLVAIVQLKGEGNVGSSVVLRDRNGETIRWTYSSKSTGDTHGEYVTLQSDLMIPQGIVSIEPRLVGNGPTVVHVKSLSLQRVGNQHTVDLFKNEPPFVLENRFLKVSIEKDHGTLTVVDKRTSRVWQQQPENSFFAAVNAKPVNDGSAVTYQMTLHEMEYMHASAKITFQLVDDAPELTVTIDGTNLSQGNVLPFPAPFASIPGDRLIIPINEGIGFPVGENDNILVHQLIAYGGHGICMSFWGQIEDATGVGQMAIIETPDDMSICVEKGIGGLLQVTPCWEPSQATFRYARSLRYVFFDQGGHVAICKRYREYAKATGLYLPFCEKVKKNPNIDLLIGAANIWSWEKDKVALVKELQESGISRILWSGGGTAKEMAEMNRLPNVLTSRYDIYQDIMNPERFDEVRGVHSDWVTEAWPNDINWVSADGTWRKGWEVETKEPGKPRIPCAVICDAKAVPYARKRIGDELKTVPYQARFIDTTVAAPWYECYHPDHPMTRTESKIHKMKLLDIVKNEFGLVCGSETGHDASVPYCDFYEGMMSLGPYRVPESGRDMARIWDKVPERVQKYQVGEQYRLPLWELVYHDCTVAYWYWGDYNNKLPAIWKKRDLFNALYGVPPMYMFTWELWHANKERFVESYRTAEPVSRLTGYSEMIDHKILSDDRSVQQTMFANGIVVTVNFGEQPFVLPDDTQIRGLGIIVTKQ